MVTSAFGQVVNNPGLDGDTDDWDCAVGSGPGVEVNTEVVYGGSVAENMVAEIDMTVEMCQEISGFIVGHEYELIFDCSGRTTCGPDDQSLDVMIEGLFLESIYRDATVFNWITEKFCFTATEETHTLRFVSTIVPEISCGMLIDNVQIIHHPFDLGGDQSICEGASIELNANMPSSTYLWQDGSTNPTFTTSDAGNYSVEVYGGDCVLYDDVDITIVDPVVDLGADQTICIGQSVSLDASFPDATYTWQDASTDATFEATESGIYDVTVAVGTCTAEDDVEITVLNPAVDIGADTSLCEGVTLELIANTPNATFTWNNASTASSITVNSAGDYWVEVDEQGCTDVDSINVQYIEPQVDLGPDVTLCAGESISLDASFPGATYEWLDGETAPQKEISTSGTYGVTVAIGSCFDYDEIEVTVVDPTIDLGADTTLCAGETIELSAEVAGATYAWGGGQSSSSIEVDQAGIYWVTTTLQGCEDSDTVTVDYIDPQIDLGDDLSMCEGDAASFFFDESLGNYTWHDASTDAEYTATVTETVSVELEVQGCIASDQIEVVVNSIPDFDLGGQIVLCQDETATLSTGLTSGTHTWQDSSNGFDLEVSTGGTYSVTVEENGCSATDSVSVIHVPNTLDLGPDASICDGDTLELSVVLDDASFTWQDGSTASNYLVTEGGTYEVEVFKYGCVYSDAIEIELIDINLDLGVDVTVCEGEATTLTSNITADTYLWQDNSTDASLNTNVEGLYTLEVTQSGCTDTDEIWVEVIENELELGNQVNLCEGESAVLDATVPNATYLWTTAATDAQITVNQSGNYGVDVAVEGCVYSDNVDVVIASPDVLLGDDQTICVGSTTILDATLPDASYLWSDGSTNATLSVDAAGEYWVQVSNENCTGIDTILINNFPPLNIDLGDDVTICQGEDITLDAGVSAASYQWNQGATTASIVVDTTGEYSVVAMQDGCEYTDAIIVTVSNPILDLGDDVTICAGTSLLLDPQLAGASYVWQDNSTASTFLVTEAGTYSATATVGNCTTFDEIEIQVGTLTVDLGDDVIACDGENVVFDATTTGATYAWSSGGSGATISPTQSGNYEVVITVNGCEASDDVNVTFNPAPTVDLGADIALCDIQDVTLDATNANAIYLWQDASTDPQLVVDQSGVYGVTVSIDDCHATDSITVAMGTPEVFLGNDTTICVGETLVLDPNLAEGDFLWQDGSTNPTLSVTQAGLYGLTVSFGQCSATDSIQVEVGELQIDLGADTTLCEGQSLVIDATVAGASYLWQDASTNESITVDQSGTYSVTVTTTNCEASDEINVTFNPIPVIDLGADTNICEVGTYVLDAFFPDANYLWQDGSTAATYSLTNTGTYEVTTNIDHCTFTDSLHINMGPPPIDLGPDTTICEGESLLITCAGFADHYNWSTGETAPVISVQDGGVYALEIEVDGCVNSDTIAVDIHPLPLAWIEGGTTFCPDELVDLNIDLQGVAPFNVVYQFNDQNYPIPEITSQTYTLQTSEPGVYTLVSVTDGYCTSILDGSVTITEFPPIELDVDAPLNMCEGDEFNASVGVSGGQGLDYDVHWSHESVDAEGTSFQLSPLDDFDVTVTAIDGCNDPVSELIEVTVHDLPEPDFYPLASEVCEATEVTFVRTDDYATSDECLWMVNGTVIDSACGETQHWFDTPGFYSVTLNTTTQYGCFASKTNDSLIQVMHNPQALFTYDLLTEESYVPKVEFTNGSSHYVEQEWSFGDGAFSTEDHVIHQYEAGIEDFYTTCLEVFNTLGCTDQHCIDVPIPLPLLMSVPNAFTPDEDGLNDIWRPVFNMTEIAEYELEIYDRGGQVIFYSTDIHEGWNGAGKKDGEYYAPIGIYTYQILLRQEGKTEKEIHRGSMNLIR